jgi:hypothetical protein
MVLRENIIKINNYESIFVCGLDSAGSEWELVIGPCDLSN